MSEENLSVMTPAKESKHDQRSPLGGTPRLDRLLAEEQRWPGKERRRVLRTFSC
jgi:hypothetical protein